MREFAQCNGYPALDSEFRDPSSDRSLRQFSCQRFLEPVLRFSGALGCSQS